ncbi:SufS family cysteine desulfurase [Actinomyces minihominis]|uniref:SufS family cysteine desulfurase n=1 Tax=Actinomyces minihominis TaxID=2002838 RepID=UPI000C0863D5|nr:SufS family cysteine desulfurase [Actinomyces minihominis]
MNETADLTAEELTAIRGDFPALEKVGRGGRPIVYLDSGATSQKPAVVIDAESEFYRDFNGAVHRNTHLLGDEATVHFEDARETLADFIGAEVDEIVWTKNATEALNLVASAFSNASAGIGADGARATGDTTLGDLSGRFRLEGGDRIVVTRAEHHSNLVPWQQVAEKTGATLSWLDLTPDGRIDLESLHVIDANTKVVAFTHASNVTGAISPVTEIVEAARKVGAITVLDTCQSSAHMPVDVRELGVDFAVFSSHKMLGPTGIGALWGRFELLEAMPPVLTGGSVVADVTMSETKYLPPPAKFEAGSQPVAQAVAWGVALRYLSEIGMEKIARHEAEMTELLLERISEIEGIRVLGPTDNTDRLGVVAFDVEGVHPHDVGQVLDFEDVAVRVGHHCAIPLHRFFGVKASSRATIALTTTGEEIDQFITGLKKVREYFGLAETQKPTMIGNGEVQ